jgi:hypothetical protein
VARSHDRATHFIDRYSWPVGYAVTWPEGFPGAKFS